MAKTKVLITVKTYPSLSIKYDETVCTAGFLEDGSWIRLYPMPFRKLSNEKQYKKYQWIEIDITRNTSDFRPESHSPVNRQDIDITILDYIDTGKKRDWHKRKEIILKQPPYTNMNKLILEAKDKKNLKSLAVFKPQKFIKFYTKETTREWDSDKTERIEALKQQLNLFETEKERQQMFEVVKKVPYEFRYVFMDDENTKRDLMIEDWEVCQLYWNCLKRHNNDEQKALEDVKKKYWDDFVLTKDLYLYLGTTKQFHNIAPNPFIIIGTFHPPLDPQLKLF